jgi:hypothetical protein
MHAATNATIREVTTRLLEIAATDGLPPRCPDFRELRWLEPKAILTLYFFRVALIRLILDVHGCS